MQSYQDQNKNRIGTQLHDRLHSASQSERYKDPSLKTLTKHVAVSATAWKWGRSSDSSASPYPQVYSITTKQITAGGQRGGCAA